MHNKEDRGMMKWQPFYSVLSEKEIKSSIDKKNIITKPELSEDQKMELENLIIEAYNSKNIISLKVYDINKYIEVEGIITKLDTIHKAIYVNKKMVPFDNIVKIKFL